jgi:CBS domain-containing protein
MQAKHVMSTHLICASPGETVQEVADRLLRNNISAVPVVEGDNRLVGIVSEGDLMRRTDTGTERRASWWLRHFGDPSALAAAYTKSHARRVRDVMTTDVVAVSPETPVAEIAELLEKHGIKRVPVVHRGEVVGIVSRANLLRALASLRWDPPPPKPSDEKIREQILAEFDREPWADSFTVNVYAKDGVVEMWGGARSEDELKAGRVLAENVPGVKKVIDRRFVMPLQWAYD